MDELEVTATLQDDLSSELTHVAQTVENVADAVHHANTEAGQTAAATGRMSKALKRGADDWNHMRSSARDFFRTASSKAFDAVKRGLTVATAAAAAGTAVFTSWASDAGEAASAFTTVFKGVSGDVSGYVDRMNKRFGITKQELHEAATGFGVFGKAAGVNNQVLGAFTKDLMGAGMDLSSFYNVTTEEAFAALKSGLSGEAEPLRRFGVFLSDATMKAEAATMGLSDELTEQQKVMVRQRIIMKSLGDAEGDLERTKNSLSNKTKALTGRLHDLGTEAGNVMTPAFEVLAGTADGAVSKALDKVKDKSGPLQKALKRGAKSANEVMNSFIDDGWDAGIAKLDEVTGANGRLKDISDDLQTVWNDLVVPVWNDLLDIVSQLPSPLGEVDDALGWVADNSETLAPLLAAVVVGLLGAKTAMVAVRTAQMIAAPFMVIYSAGLVTTATASEAAAVGTWSFNAALRANPIGIVVTVIGVLIGLLFLAVQHWDDIKAAAVTAGDKIGESWDWLYEKVLTPIGQFFKGAFIAAVKVAGTAGLTMAKGFVIAWQFVLKVFLGVVGAMLDGAAKAFGWMPGLGGKLKDARDSFHGFEESLTDNFESIKTGIDKAQESLDGLGKKKPKVDITVATHYTSTGKPGPGHGVLKPAAKETATTYTPLPGQDLTKLTPKQKSKLPIYINPYGDTRTSMARGRGSAANTLGAHHLANRAAGGNVRISNMWVGGGGRGHGSGDHQRGRAIDVVGTGLHRYQRAIREDGGYAEFHGTGAARHLHAVPAEGPMGDTAGSVATRRRHAAGGGIVVERGGITVHVHGGAPVDADELADELLAAVVKLERDRNERSNDL